MMKKYLMTAIAAVAMGAAFTSCSHNDDLYNGEENNKQNEQQQIALAESEYAAVFEQTFGKVGANVDWGFGHFASTRGINVNGNLWAETPECTSAEQQLVFNYVNMTRDEMRAANHKFDEVFPENITNYFVTQVYTGQDVYNDGDGSSIGKGSSHMDNLHIAMKSDAKLVDGALIGAESSWEHINNFNAGSNMNYGGNTLVYDGGTLDFVYMASTDSRYHNKWIAVKGEDIDASLAGKYYICFDYISENPQAQTNWRASFWNPEGNNGGEWQEKNFTINGYYTVDGLKKLTFTVELWSVKQNKNIEYTYSLGDETKVKNVRIDNAVGGNKVVEANDVYTDWIVRIVPAKNYRVIAEDLNANSSSDFDFNDVAFDIIKIEGGKTQLKLLCAGGIYPIRIGENADNEIHKLFGVESNCIVNTGSVAGYPSATKDPVLFWVDGEYSDPGKINSLKIYVNKVGDTWTELKANRGTAACKILVDSRFGIMGERTNISTKYASFPKYVKGEIGNDEFQWWYNSK